MVMRHRDVHDRQHHENERLDRDDQDVEDAPHGVTNDARPEQQPVAGAKQPGNKHKYQLTSVHVAKQSHRQTHRFGKQLDDVQRKIRQPQQRVRQTVP